jgi:hypothetical protein
MFGIVYKVTNTINDKCYIGITTQDFKKYQRRHYLQSKRKSEKYKAFHEAIRKYGFNNFIWEILEECKTKNDLCNREIFYIKYFNSYIGFDNSNGYNMTLGGERYSYNLKDHPYENEIRNKLSNIRKGKTYEEIFGKDESIRLKQLRSIQMKNREVSDYTRKKTKNINRKLYFIINIITKEYLYIDDRKELEFVCNDTFYRIKGFKTNWVILDIIKLTDIENCNKIKSYNKDHIEKILQEFMLKNKQPKNIRKKRKKSNITKGKTYEEIYGDEIAKTLRQRNNK